MKSALPLGSPRQSPRAAIGGKLAQWAGVVPDNSHSRRVALLKRVLPAIGVSLLLLVAVWPRLAPLLERMRFAFPAIDLREARELRMMNPRYLGTDRENRPFVVTAAVGQQVPDRDDLMSLESPKADFKAHNGANVVLTAATGIYQSQTQVLDLFGNVTMTHENGTTFTTDAARLNIANNSAQGDDPVEGHGPSGDVQAQGFRIFDKGDSLIFSGRSDLVLKGAKSTGTAPEPPTVPPVVAAQAAAVEASAKPALAAAAAKKPAKTAARPSPRHAAPHRHVAARRLPHPAARSPAKKAGAT